MIRPGTYKIVPRVTPNGHTRWQVRLGLFVLSPEDIYPEMYKWCRPETADWATPEDAAAALEQAVWAHGRRIKAERRRQQAVAAAKAARQKTRRWP